MAHDGGVLFRPLERVGVTAVAFELREQCDRSLLHRHVLGMLEGHVQEAALVNIKCAVEARIHNADGRDQRLAVTGECAWRIAKRVAGELVEQHHVGERSVEIAPPIAKLPAQRSVEGVAEALADRCIESRILAKPLGADRVGSTAEPKFENVSGKRRHVLCYTLRLMRTSYRDIFLLACCQALLLTNASGLITMNGLVGYSLADTKALATLGVTAYILGSAVATMPASLWMARVGRRAGFMAGALVNIGGCALAAFALWRGSFALYCVATALIGVYNAIGLQYRFAAAEVAAPADKAKAISLVLAGGVVGGVIGPESVKRAVDLFATPFLGGFVALAAYAVVALALQSQVHVPPPTLEERSGGGRPLSAIIRQPVFIVAALAGGLGYGLMNLLMTATPIAMNFCSHPFSAVALVIEWHVVGMYAPGFFTGTLIRRFGVLNVILAGLVLIAASVAVALNGNTIPDFVAALALVGVGWNFMYTGGTTLLTESYTPAEKARTQGANDFIVFATMGVTSVASGAMVSTAGWETMNLAVLPFLALIAAAVIWFGWWRRSRTAQVA